MKCHFMSPVMFVWRHVQQISLETTPLDDVNHVSTFTIDSRVTVTMLLPGREMHVVQLTGSWSK